MFELEAQEGGGKPFLSKSQIFNVKMCKYDGFLFDAKDDMLQDGIKSHRYLMTG